MANEHTTTTGNDLYIAAQLDQMVAEELRPRNVMRPLMRYAKLTQSKAHDWPISDDPGAAAAATEGTAISNTAFTTSKATATAASVGMQITLTDELAAISVMDAYSWYSGVLVRSVLEKYETDFTALVDDFSNTTSTSGVDCTVDTFLAAVAALVQRDIPGPYVAVLHPVQTTDLSRDNASSLAVQAGQRSDGSMITDSGFQFTIGDVAVFQSSLVPTANSAADRAGGIFSQGQALGLAETWDARTESIRVPALPGTQIDCFANYGVVEIRDTFGQSLITDA